MPMYSMSVSATSNTVVDTEDSFLNVIAAAGSRCLIKRVKISVQSPASDARSIIKLLRQSALGAGGAAGVVAKVDSGVRASSVTLAASVKNGITNMAVGTLVDTIDVINMNGRAIHEWADGRAAGHDDPSARWRVGCASA